MSAFDQSYEKTNWINNTTPINQSNLNHVENGIDLMQQRTNVLMQTKIEGTYVNSAIKNITFNDANGIFTFTRFDNSTFQLDTDLEKVVTNFDYDASKQALILQLKDGKTKEISLSAFITETEFQDSDHIVFSLAGNHVVKADVKAHSIGEDELRTDYLADIRKESADAHTDAIRSRSYAVGDTSSRQGEETDNAKYYKEQTIIEGQKIIDDTNAIKDETQELAQYAKDTVLVSQFLLDTNGNLLYEDNSVHIFTVDDNGNLLYEVKGAI